jgi:hypothetical protein
LWSWSPCAGLLDGPPLALDNHPPVASSVSASPNPFYPYPDGYKDTTRVSFNVSEYSWVTLWIYPHGSTTVVRRIDTIQNGGSAHIDWNGRNQSGAFLPRGTYDYLLSLTDSAGNRTITQRWTVGLS